MTRFMLQNDCPQQENLLETIETLLGMIGSRDNEIQRLLAKYEPTIETPHRPKAAIPPTAVNSILIIEKNKHMSIKLSQLLGQQGMVVVNSTEDIEHALDLFRQFNPEFVIMEHNPPHLEAFEVTRRIREISKSAKVLISCYNWDTQLTLKAAKIGAVDTFDKPVNPDRLLQLIKSHSEAA